jgi:3-hydroxy-9,10-secoandrosta-1,3,5(10)-triene-9,17-dione monooxygenase
MPTVQQAHPGREGVPSHAELVLRAAALVPALRERAVEAERLRRLPPDNVAALRGAGLLKVLQARRYGGWQMSLRTHVDVVSTLARGCASTAWCVGVVHAHSWLLGHFPQKAQEDLYGQNPEAFVSAVIAPRGTARVVEGGYLLNGVWPFGSGCQASDWLLLGAAVLDAKGEAIDEGDLAVPTAQVTIKDDWNVVGLRGTGSCTLMAKDLFVPQHRFVSLPGAIEGRSPGIELHDGWLYRSAAVPVLALAITPSALGAAETALEVFKTRLPGREVAYTAREVQLQMPVTHMQTAQAATRIDTARLLLHHCADAIQEAAEKGETMEFTQRARVRMDCAYAVRLCMDAVEILYLASGGSGIAEANPIQRAWRDLHAVNMHGLLNLQTNEEMYGRVLLGLEPNTPLI